MLQPKKRKSDIIRHVNAAASINMPVQTEPERLYRRIMPKTTACLVRPNFIRDAGAQLITPIHTVIVKTKELL